MSLPSIKVQNLSAVEQSQVPLTFGHVFAPGHLMPSDGLKAGSTPLQVDIKATHADGSVRHAVLSGVLPLLKAGETLTLPLVPAKAGSVEPTAIRLGFESTVKATIGKEVFCASLDDLLKAGPRATWLDGQHAVEWQVAAPLETDAGVGHPHLHVRFAARWYEGAKKARIDITLENDWAYEPDPQNFIYDLEIKVGGKLVYTHPALTHFHHARWRKVFWLGDEPAINILHDTSYLISTGAIPNYEPVEVPAFVLDGLQGLASRNNFEPMGNGLVSPYMPMTGGRDDIGIFPSWQTTWLESQNPRAKDIMLHTADLAGSFSAHYRDKNTDQPVCLADYPYMTINGNPGDTWNPKTDKLEYFPGLVKGQSDTPYVHDAAHQPNMAYLPYLITGDLYYLEELQFYASWYSFETNPGYRGAEKGIMSSEQVRGQAWALRTLFEAAYITPDADRLKGVFTSIVDNNLDWYIGIYISDPDPKYANNLGIIVNGFAFEYQGGTAIAPWQQHFFLSAIGHGVELGFTKAKTLLEWLVKFPINSMIGEGFCWIDATMYDMKVRKSEFDPIFVSMAEVYANNRTADFPAMPCGGPEMAKARGLQVGEMVGISNGYLGYPSNMQPALAYAADYGGEDGKRAWNLFMSRSVKPDYRLGSQFNIVPRSMKTDPVTTPIGTPTAPGTSIPPVLAPAPVLQIGQRPADGLVGTWVKIGDEDGHIRAEKDTYVRYGAPGYGYVYALARGDFDATNAAFGNDPAVNVVKQVERFTLPVAPAFKVQRVTRYQVTEALPDGSINVLGEYESEMAANRVKAALEKANVA